LYQSLAGMFLSKALRASLRSRCDLLTGLDLGLYAGVAVRVSAQFDYAFKFSQLTTNIRKSRVLDTIEGA
jgi:hypothetical protein